MESTRTLWPYPRRRHFVEQVRRAATKWFLKRGYATDAKYPYILAAWADWQKNIILPEVGRFIEVSALEQRTEGNNFPLHKYIHHGLSSQAMLFNLIGPLLVANDLSPLKTLIERKGLAWPGAGAKARLEYEDRSVFNEQQGQPTSIDLAIMSQDGTPSIFIEAKLVEQEFGGCSVFEDGDCDGRNPSVNLELCYLHHIGRKYWTLMQQHGLDQGPIGRDTMCVLVSHYQFFRELLFALEKGGIFVLLSDERSPVFQCDGPLGERGLVPLLTALLPPEVKHKVAMISIQEMLREIGSRDGNEWTYDFADKYGLREHEDPSEAGK